MSIESDFDAYKTVDGYLCPNPIPPGTLRGCDNQLMFTSEYVILLSYNGVLTDSQRFTYATLLAKSMDSNNYIHRAPDDKEVDQSPDDYHGVYAACVILGIKPTIRLPMALYRFPQLILLRFAASGGIPLPLRTLSPIVAFIVALSSLGVPTSKTDERRLSWLLIQGLSPHSWLVRLASKIWYKRLYKDYVAGMMNVASIYYSPQGMQQNPYSKYWKEKS